MQGKLAEMYTMLQASRAMLYSVARGADEGKISNTVNATLMQGLRIIDPFYIFKRYAAGFRGNLVPRRKWIYERISNW